MARVRDSVWKTPWRPIRSTPIAVATAPSLHPSLGHQVLAVVALGGGDDELRAVQSGELGPDVVDGPGVGSASWCLRPVATKTSTVATAATASTPHTATIHARRCLGGRSG